MRAAVATTAARRDGAFLRVVLIGLLPYCLSFPHTMTWGADATTDVWQRTMRRSFEVTALQMDTLGDAVALGSVHGRVAVVKIAGTTGKRLWSMPVRFRHGRNYDHAPGLMLDSRGDAVIGGSFWRADVSDPVAPSFTVVKLAGADGRRRWSATVHDTGAHSGSVRGIAIDANDDVIAAGSVSADPPAFDTDIAVVKLSGPDGRELWRWIYDQPPTGNYDATTAFTIDQRGDVYVLGDLGFEFGGSGAVVVKLSGADGRVVWMHELEAYTYPLLIVSDGAEGVVVAGGTQDVSGPRVHATKLAGATGDTVWTVAGASTPSGWARAVAIDAQGDVVLGVQPLGSGNVSVAKLIGATGSTAWRRDIGASARFRDVPHVAVGPDGSIVVGASVRNENTCFDVLIARLDNATGDVVTTRSFDGSATTRRCIADPSKGPVAGPDQDRTDAIAIDGAGNTIGLVALSNGSRANWHYTSKAIKISR
jgi:hypothetical protein